MIEVSATNCSNFKWCHSSKENRFIVLNNNSFTVYEIVEGPNHDSRKQDTELSVASGTLAVKALYPSDTHSSRRYRNFIVNPSRSCHLISSCQQKLYYIDLEKGDSRDILNLSMDRRQAAKRINLLEWNPKCPEVIALTIEKHRMAKGIHIADINKSTVIREFGGEGEAVQSIAWSPHNPDILIAGTSKKRLEVFDMRGKTKDQGRKPHDIQEVEGVCFSPKFKHIIASHSDEYVKVWDIRNLRNAAHVHAIKSPSMEICRLEWCPTHPTRLSYMTKQGNHIQIRDFSANTLEKGDSDQVEFTGVPEHEPQQRQKSTPDMQSSTIASFSWHPHLPNRILCCKQTDETEKFKLYDIALYEPIIAKFSPADKLVWGCSDVLVDCSLEEEDVAEITQDRIRQGYGFDPTLNKRLVAKNPGLFAMWSFFESVKRRDGPKEEHGDLKFRDGIYDLIIESSERAGSRRERMSSLPGSIFFISPERNKCLEICSWPTVSRTTHEDLNTIVNRLRGTGEQDKAVALTLFYVGVDNAIHLLQKMLDIGGNAEDHQRILDLLFALSGFTGDQNSLWSEKMKMLGKSVTNPYQRAMFTFLTTEPGRDDGYSSILEDRSLQLEDRIAFACRFLPDQHLRKRVESVCVAESSAGNIRAVVLTGVKYQIRVLLQQYLDNTSDVQTVCLALAMARRYDSCHETDAENPEDLQNIVLDCYLRYFDKRCMWIERALFQNERRQLLKSRARVDQHVLVRCSCSKSISDRPTQMYNTPKQPSNKEVHDKRFCPSKYCESMLPRCALCMYHLGTTSRYQPHLPNDRRQYSVEADSKQSPIKDWFTWCVECQHGGHSAHAREWFADHKICPSPGCKCNCALLDMAPSLDSLAL